LANLSKEIIEIAMESGETMRMAFRKAIEKGHDPENPEPTVLALVQLLHQLPIQSVALAKFSVDIGILVLNFFQDYSRFMPEALNEEYAYAARRLSEFFRQAGQRSEALEVGRKAVSLYKDLAKKEPQAYESQLADSLIGLGLCFGDFGRYDQAKQQLIEAEGIFSRLSEHNPELYLPKLGYTYSNLGTVLWKNKENKDAFE
jgi:tetratricopeptide (TPR) repeat protein